MLEIIHRGKILFLCLVVLLSCPLSRAQDAKQADEAKIVTLGVKAILNDNMPDAREGAVNQALEAAVEQAVLEMLTRKDVTANLALLYDQVVKSAADYVTTYKVLTEMESRNRVLVAVESRVNTSALESFFSRVSILGREGKDPTLLFLIAEQVPGEILPRYWWGKNPLPYESAAEQAAAEFMAAKGFHLMGVTPPRPVPEELGVTFDYINDVEAGVRLAGELKADIVVLGRAVAKDSSNVMGQERTYQADMSLDAYSAVSGEMIASVKRSSAVTNTVGTIGYQNALTQVGSQAGQELAIVISRHWTDDKQGPVPIEIRIEGADYLSSFILLRRILNQMEGIDDIKTRELGSNQAVVDIVSPGGARNLADALMLKTFDSFGIEISDVEEKSLTIRFVTKENMKPVKDSEIEDAHISE